VSFFISFVHIGELLVRGRELNTMPVVWWRYDRGHNVYDAIRSHFEAFV